MKSKNEIIEIIFNDLDDLRHNLMKVSSHDYAREISKTSRDNIMSLGYNELPISKAQKKKMVKRMKEVEGSELHEMIRQIVIFKFLKFSEGPYYKVKGWPFFWTRFYIHFTEEGFEDYIKILQLQG